MQEFSVLIFQIFQHQLYFFYFFRGKNFYKKMKKQWRTFKRRLGAAVAQESPTDGKVGGSAIFSIPETDHEAAVAPDAIIGV